MGKHEEGLKLIEERCGNKDNVISLATIDIKTEDDGMVTPVVRDVDAYYEDGVFYIVTSGNSSKMQQIENNNHVAFSVNSKWLTGKGIGKNLGWVMESRNKEMRSKLREIFKDWYDVANNEDDHNCCILAIYITKATVIKDHGAITYKMDFINKKIIDL